MEQNDIITLLDENGEEARFEHVLTFVYEGERYIALVPEEEAEGDEAEVLLLHIEERDGADVYVSIDNEILLNEVFDEFLSNMEELEGGSDGDDAQ